MRRGSTVQVKIDKTEFPSVGVGELEGKKIYVKSFRTNSFRKGKEKRRLCNLNYYLWMKGQSMK